MRIYVYIYIICLYIRPVTRGRPPKGPQRPSGARTTAHKAAHNLRTTLRTTPPLRTTPRNPRLPKGYEHTNMKFRIHMQPAACLNA